MPFISISLQTNQSFLKTISGDDVCVEYVVTGQLMCEYAATEQLILTDTELTQFYEVAALTAPSSQCYGL